jgi:hypothetical protein
VAADATAKSLYNYWNPTMDDDDQVPAAIVFGILGPVFDWTEEQRAAAEPAPETNVINFADYKKLH